MVIYLNYKHIDAFQTAAKEKALELYNKYEQLARDFTRGVSMKEFAKLCALKAVDEMFNYFNREGFKMAYPEIALSEINYLEEVRKEIEAL